MTMEQPVKRKSGFMKDGYLTPKGWSAAIAAGALTLFVVGALLFAWPFKKVDQGTVGLSYGGGIIEGRHFQGIKEPGGLFANGFGDKLYRYPTTQRNYIVSKQRGEGDRGHEDSIHAVSLDNVSVEFEVATYFKLNTNNRPLRDFHEQIGLKYEAWDSDGWNKMLNDSFRQQIENALQAEARGLTVASIYSDQKVLQTVQNEVGETLRDRVADSLGGDYFCGPTFVRGKGDCPEFSFIIKRVSIPEKVKAAFESNRTSAIEVQTKQNEVAQAKAQAEAATALAQAIANNPNYVELKRIEALRAAIDSGKVSFWVLPENSSLTLPTGGK